MVKSVCMMYAEKLGKLSAVADFPGADEKFKLCNFVPFKDCHSSRRHHSKRSVHGLDYSYFRPCYSAFIADIDNDTLHPHRDCCRLCAAEEQGQEDSEAR